MSEKWSQNSFVVRKISRVLNETYTDCESPAGPNNKDRYGGERDTNPSKLSKDIYAGETHNSSPEILLPNWAESIEDYTLGMVVDPDGFRIEMEADYFAPEVDGDTNHTVKLFKNTDQEQYPASEAGTVPDVGEYFATYKLNGPESKSGTEIVNLFEKGDTTSLEHPLFFGSDGAEVSEPQAAVFLAEWTHDRMQEGSSSFLGSGIGSLSKGRRSWPKETDFQWANANFMYDEGNNDYPTAASKMSLEGKGVYDVDAEEFVPSGINPFDLTLDELEDELEEFFPEPDTNNWVPGTEPFWYSPPKREVEEEQDSLSTGERHQILEEIQEMNLK